MLRGGLVDYDTNNAAAAELIRRIGSGDRAAFEEFYGQFAGLVFSTALRVLGDATDAEDVSQEVLFMLWEKAPMFDGTRGKPLTWIITMARNKSIDRLRSLGRRHRLYDEVQQELTMEPVTTHREPFEDLDHYELGQAIRGAVQKLNPQQREAIEMAYFSGLTQQEIAARLREPLGTVKARIRRGMLRLRQLLGRKRG